MILSYSRDRFVEGILTGRKRHTIREDKHRRWRPGMTIHHWRGNPRNVKAHPYPFATGVCKGVQAIEIRKDAAGEMKVRVDGRVLSAAEVEMLAAQDDLSLEEFRLWFLPAGRERFVGRVIHFTDLRY